jgi:hypothetical protein
LESLQAAIAQIPTPHRAVRRLLIEEGVVLKESDEKNSREYEVSCFVCEEGL